MNHTSKDKVKSEIPDLSKQEVTGFDLLRNLLDLKAEVRELKARFHESDSFMSTGQVAAYCKVSKATVLSWCDAEIYGRDALVHYPLSRSWTFLRADVDHFINRFRTQKQKKTFTQRGAA